MSKNRLGFAAWILGCVAGGALVGVASAGGDSPWYHTLPKPAWTPPSWVFAPVWTTLYAAMGLSAGLVWQRGGWATQRMPLLVFLAQLALNFAWSFIFFAFHQIEWALVDIVILGVLIIVTMIMFARVDPRASWLLVPYLAWVSFAAVLNARIAQLAG
jgi:tryptophan-rich sensory protein